MFLQMPVIFQEGLEARLIGSLFIRQNGNQYLTRLLKVWVWKDYLQFFSGFVQ